MDVLQHDNHFRSIVESLTQVVIEIDARDRTIRYINHLVPGFTLDMVIGKSILEFVLPSYHQAYYETLDRCLKENIPVCLELEGMAANGAVVWYRSHISPVLHADGSTTMIIISENIQAQKEAEMNAVLRERKLYAVINNTTDMILSIDADLRVMEFNQAMAESVKMVFGIELHSGLRVMDIIFDKNKGHQMSIYLRVLNGEKLADVEIYDIEGVPTFFETHYNPIRNAINEVVGIAVYSRNIDSRIRKEALLSNALREKELLLSEIHHRLKNNLAIISSLLELQEHQYPNEETRKALNVSRQRIKSTALIHELLYENASFEQIDLHRYLQRLFIMMRDSAGKKQISLKMNAEKIMIANRDAVPVGLLFNELFTNSFKHAFKDLDQGELQMEFIPTENGLQIILEESHGHFPENVDFENPDSTGLLIIRSFIDQLQGEIKVHRSPKTRYEIHLMV